MALDLMRTLELGLLLLGMVPHLITGYEVRKSLTISIDPLLAISNVTAKENCSFSILPQNCEGEEQPVTPGTQACFKWACDLEDVAIRVDKCVYISKLKSTFPVVMKGCGEEGEYVGYTTPLYEEDLKEARLVIDLPIIGSSFLKFESHITLYQRCAAATITPPIGCYDMIGKPHVNWEIAMDNATYEDCRTSDGLNAITLPPVEEEGASSTASSLVPQLFPTFPSLPSLHPSSTPPSPSLIVRRMSRRSSGDSSLAVLVVPFVYIICHFLLTLYLRPEDWYRK